MDEKVSSSEGSLDAQIKEISEKSGTAVEELKKLIEEKKDELSGLVSEEGAMHIVARELGVNLLKEKNRELKLANLVSGLRSVDIVGKIVNISDTRQFERNGKQGQVLNVTLGDESGTVRMSMWNDEINVIQKLGLKEGDCIKLCNGYVKIDNRNNPELRLGRGVIEKTDANIEITKTQFGTGSGAQSAANMPVKRRTICEFQEGGFEEARAALVQIFRRNPFYNVCPTCDARVTESDGTWQCDEHGKVEPKKQLVLSGVLDDGTDNIRVVFFRDIAERAFGKNTDDLVKIATEANDPMAIYDHFENLGKELIVRGRVKKNNFTDNIELVANAVEEVDLKKETGVLIKELKASGKASSEAPNA